MDVERRLLWVGSSIALLSLIYVVFSVSMVDLRHVGVMLVFFGVAGFSLYGAFRVYRESKIRWLLFGMGFIVASVAVSQLSHSCRPNKPPHTRSNRNNKRLRSMKDEKKAFLILYAVSLIMAVAIFLYLTRIEGYTTEDITKVGLMVLLPVLALHSIGGAIILKHYRGKPKETNS
ncbi:hypothetical protein [Pyrococcus abyssi]|nr:hypothetical protein [Pyrococcus abyssi]CCE71112.1 TPA: hypothetical protein PAB1264 [Pyrococcus abyssi GE5]